MNNLEIFQELRALRIAFAKAVDEKNWELFMQTLTDEVEVDYTDFGIPTSTMTKRQVADVVSGALKSGVKTQHFLSNFDHKIQDNSAEGTVYVLAKHFMPNHDGTDGESFDVNARYIDSYVLTPSGWKISKFKLSVSWSTGNVSSVFNL